MKDFEAWLGALACCPACGTINMIEPGDVVRQTGLTSALCDCQACTHSVLYELSSKPGQANWAELFRCRFIVDATAERYYQVEDVSCSKTDDAKDRQAWYNIFVKQLDRISPSNNAVLDRDSTYQYLVNIGATCLAMAEWLYRRQPGIPLSESGEVDPKLAVFRQ